MALAERDVRVDSRFNGAAFPAQGRRDFFLAAHHDAFDKRLAAHGIGARHTEQQMVKH